VNLVIKYHLTENVLLRILAQILPLVESIDSINCENLDLFKMAYDNNDEDYADDDQEQDEDDDYDYRNSNVSHQSQLMLKTMMAQTRVLKMPIEWLDFVVLAECFFNDSLSLGAAHINGLNGVAHGFTPRGMMGSCEC
jgi:hypothetical protein